MRWVSRLVTVAIAAVLLGAIALAIVTTVRRDKGYRWRTSASFRDGSKLPVGSRVMVAGVQVGEIVQLTVDGRLARIEIRMRDDIPLYDDAWAEKKAESLFADAYVEIHQGTEGRRRLENGEPIPRVMEGASPDRTLRSLDQGMPRAREVLGQARRFAEEARLVVDGDLAESLEDLDRAIQDPELTAPLRRADEALARFEERVDRAAVDVAAIRPDVAPALDRFDRGITEARDDMREGEASVKDSLATARARLDEVDPFLEDGAELMARLDGEAPPEDQGRMGRLINDPELGNDIADLAEDGADATAGLTARRAFVQLRAQYNFLARQAHVALGVEISGRHDNFVLLEVERNDAGLFPEVALSDRLGDDVYVRTARVDEGLLLTLQWGHRFDNLAVRFGIRENEFAAGADVKVLDSRLELKSDLFLPPYQRVPRLRMALAMRVFESAYVLGGIDDALRTGGAVPIQPWPDDQDVPRAFDSVWDGRDFFFGGYLRFSDRDLDTLLLLYGATLLAGL